MSQKTLETISKLVSRKGIPLPTILIAGLYLVMGFGGFLGSSR